MEQWELNRIERLESRVDKLEWKNRERSTFWLNFTTWAFVAVIWIWAIVVVATHASHS